MEQKNAATDILFSNYFSLYLVRVSKGKIFKAPAAVQEALWGERLSGTVDYRGAHKASVSEIKDPVLFIPLKNMLKHFIPAEGSADRKIDKFKILSGVVETVVITKK